MIFLDEIDKIAGRESGHGPDVSREGVQRDILPIVEGTTVNTRYGMVRTDHILFIAAGAFHVAKPSDLIPELQEPEVHFDIRGAPRVGLNVDVVPVRAKNFASPLLCELLDLVNIDVSPVVAPPRVTLGVLVVEDAAHGLQHGAGSVVLRRDHLQALLLAFLLFFDYPEYFRVLVFQDHIISKTHKT